MNESNNTGGLGGGKFWARWAEILIARPWPVIMVGMSISVALAIAAMRAPADLSFTGMMDKKDPEFIEYRKAVEKFGQKSGLVLLLEGEPDDLQRLSERLVRELPLQSPARSVTPPGDPQWVMDRAPWLWPKPLFDSAVRAATGEASDQTSAATLKLIRQADRFVTERLRPTDRAMLLSVELPGDLMDMAMGGRDFAEIQRETERIVAEFGAPGLTAGYTGYAAIGAEDQNSVFTRIRLFTPLTLLAVLFILRGVESRLSRLALAGVALAGSVAISFGMTSLIMGRLTITTTFLGMLLLGLGIDFAVHMLVALRDARARGRGPEDAVRDALGGTGPAIFLGGSTSGLAFAAIMIAPQPGALDAGLSAGFGLAGALFLMLTFLPAAWLILERRHRTEIEAPPRFELPGLPWVVERSLRHPWFVVAASVVLVVIGVTGLPRYSMESDLKKIITRNIPSLKVEERLVEIYDLSPTSYVAEVDSIEQAREAAERIRREPDIAEVQSPSDWVVEDAAAREETLDALFADEPEADKTDDQGDIQDPARAILKRLMTARSLGPIELAGLPEALKIGMIGPEGELALRIVPKQTEMDALIIEEQLDRLREIVPSTTGLPVITKMALIGNRGWVPYIGALIISIVLIVLWVSFRNPRDVVMAFLPVGVGALFSLGLYCWLGLHFSVLTSIVMPVILGLGVDDGIHVVARLRGLKSMDDASIHEAVESVGRAIFLTTVTTVVSFVSLLFINHAGLESIAHFMMIALPMCFIASVTLLPAVAKLWARAE